MRVVRAFGQEPRHRRRFAQLNDERREANMQTVYLNAAYFPSVRLLSAVATAAILIYGGNQVLDGATTIGVLASFVFYLQTFFDPIQSLSQLYTTYQAGMAALDKIFELLDEEPEIRDRPDAVDLPRVRGEIEFDDVTFGYGADGEPALREVWLPRAGRPDRRARGLHGRGQVDPARSSWPAYYDPDRGRVLIDGHDIRDGNRTLAAVAVRRGAAGRFLFSGTIRENIAFGRPDARGGRIAAARAVGAHDFIGACRTATTPRSGSAGASVGRSAPAVAFARAAAADPAS